MKYLLSLFIFLQVSSAFSIREVGDGGGGVFIDGQYMTFYSAQIPLLLTPLEFQNIPGSTYLFQKIQDMAITPDTRRFLISKIYPTSYRHYYQVDESKLDPKQLKMLIKKYADLTQTPASSLVIFAMTDSQNASTALLPSFFKLKKDSERAAILLHEGMWLTGKNASYEKIVQVELAAQAYFEKGDTDTETYFNFYSVLARLLYRSTYDVKRLLVYASVPQDLKKNHLTSVDLGSGKIYLKDFFGKSYLECMGNAVSERTRFECNNEWAIDLLQRSHSKPDFLMLKVLAEYYLQSDVMTEILALDNQTIITFQDLGRLSDVYIDFNQATSPEYSYPIYRGKKVIGYFLP